MLVDDEPLLGGPADDKPMITGNTFIDDTSIATADFHFGRAALAGFAAAARKLKQAEAAVQEARAEYAEAVKKLSEEAVK